MTGYALLVVFGRQGVAGAFLADHLGITLAFRWDGRGASRCRHGLPADGARRSRLGIEAVDPRLEEAAGTLGANRAWTFALVTLPLVAPSILAGAILAFAKAMGEFGATITFVSSIPGRTQDGAVRHLRAAAGAER